MAVWLTITSGPGSGGQVEVGEGVVIGRDPDADLTIEDPGISRRHAELRTQGVTAIVSDLGSSNGTFVNGERIETATRLRTGDLIQLGAVTIEVDAGTTETEQIGAPAATEITPQPPRPPPPPRRPPPEPAYREEPARPAYEPVFEQERLTSGLGNWPAIAAIILGPLSILLLVAGSGAAFYAALPCGIAAIAFASVGKRRAEGGAGMRGVAVAGQVAGAIGSFLATLVILVLIAAGIATDIAADNLADLVDEVESEIRNEVQVP